MIMQSVRRRMIRRSTNHHFSQRRKKPKTGSTKITTSRGITRNLDMTGRFRLRTTEKRQEPQVISCSIQSRLVVSRDMLWGPLGRVEFNLRFLFSANCLTVQADVHTGSPTPLVQDLPSGQFDSLGPDSLEQAIEVTFVVQT